MSKPFDATIKDLFELQPEAWAKLSGYDALSVEICNVDLSTVTASADELLLIDRKEAAHFEFEVNYKRNQGERVLFYNVLSRRKLGVPVQSFLVLLRREADGPASNGIHRENLVDGTNYLEFKYKVIRVWELSPETLLKCGLGMLPLAFVANVADEKLPELVRRAQKRLAKEPKKKEIWTTVGILLSLRHDPDFITKLLKGVIRMKESSFYQMALEEGREEGMEKGREAEARKILLRLATTRFGKPDAKTLKRINRVASVNQLEDLTERVSLVANWKDLLGE